MDEQARYQEAKKRAEEIRGFYHHLVSYIVVNTILVIMNLVWTPEYLWFIWTTLGWGVGIIFHAVSVYGNLWGKAWEERKIREIMDKDKRF
ncbi:2TM domain-containing protein [Saccharicrinis carchari]|uniref:2TM domain-containing protein n=1 Tax=Saccharicrinis carchari TaxID=1168039 RepID=A0A521AQC1_SACCC|nr:2TM domain-containing protein [Saccharicrinis carchari]SMO37019.1 2TM domain-containing protein [Saccharicrinis carchari]